MWLISSRCLTRCDEDSSKFLRLLVELRGDRERQQTGFDEDLDPIRTLVRFLNGEAKLRYELPVGSSATDRPIVGADAGPGAKQLAPNDALGIFRWKSDAEMNCVDREVFCPCAKFLWSHGGLQEHDLYREEL